jgi:hypothetical protein
LPGILLHLEGLAVCDAGKALRNFQRDFHVARHINGNLSRSAYVR